MRTKLITLLIVCTLLFTACGNSSENLNHKINLRALFPYPEPLRCTP